MQATAETGPAVTVTLSPPHPGGGMLRCGWGRRSHSSGTKARIADDVAEQGARRLGTLAILTAVSVVASVVVKQLLQAELAPARSNPVFLLSTIFLILASVALAVAQRSGKVRPQTLLDLGLAFEIAGAFAIAAMENSIPWPDGPIRGSTFVAAWIALCALVIPNTPWKSITAAFVSAAMVPAAHLMAALVVAYPVMPWNRLASYSLGPLFVAAWMPFISTRIQRMQEELSRTQDLGSYRLDELLGKGGMGEVWRARHRLLRRDAAVKLVIPDLLMKLGPGERRHIQQRFEQEAQSIARLRSPHTVSLYDFGVSDEGSMYYVMELLDGIDAEKLVDLDGPQPPARVISLIRQICESLEEAHDLGMVHRDIKPSNVFICRLGKRTDFVKVLDFGLVKALQSPFETRLTMAGETSGTPAFMAPEQVRSEPDVDARADIYGVGCVAYYLLTGTLVFDERSPMSMALAHVEKEPEPPSNRTELPIPASLERIVMACLEKKPEDRPQSAAELAQLLDDCTDIPEWTQADANRWWSLHRPATTPEKPESH
jgi:serine/threonine-protein kinase